MLGYYVQLQYPFADCALVGSYYNVDGDRYYIHLRSPTGKRSMPLARYLMSLQLERELHSDEVVHHINHTSTDDSLHNLQLMTTKEHQRHHQCKRKSAQLKLEFPRVKKGSKYKDEQRICPACKCTFMLTALQVRKRVHHELKNPKMQGPFCSLKCVGRFVDICISCNAEMPSGEYCGYNAYYRNRASVKAAKGAFCRACRKAIIAAGKQRSITFPCFECGVLMTKTSAQMRVINYAYKHGRISPVCCSKSCRVTYQRKRKVQNT